MALTKAYPRMIKGASISVKDFGAVGDGLTDDSAAISAAIDAIDDNTSLSFPEGTYLISTFISKTISSKSNIKIFGENAEIKFNLDGPNGFSSTQFFIIFDECNNVEVCDLALNGNAYIVSGLFFDACTKVNVHDCRFEKFWVDTSTVYDGMAVYAIECVDVIFSNNTFFRINRGISFDEQSAHSTNVVIDGNDFNEMGFGCITPAQKNCVVSNNSMRYCSLGPFPLGSYTRTNMRDDSWFPPSANLSNPSFYGAAKGPAINLGSGLDRSAEGWYAFPENVLITNNTIDYVAEYAIGFECARYYDAAPLFAGQGKNVIISNNNISNVGTVGLFCQGIDGLSITGNNIKNCGLSTADNEAILIVARAISATYQGESLANRQKNACKNVTISGNNIIDDNAESKYAIWISAGNTQYAIEDVTITGNNFKLSHADARAIVIYSTVKTDYPADSRDLYRINISANNFDHTGGGDLWYAADGCDLVQSQIYGNTINNYTSSYHQTQAWFDFVGGQPELATTGQSTTYTGVQDGSLFAAAPYPKGTLAVAAARNILSFQNHRALMAFKAENGNGPTLSYIGSQGQGTGGNYLPATIVAGSATSSDGLTYSNYFTANNSSFAPGANNAFTLGNASSRWSEVFAINGTINTSDENYKEQIGDIDDAILTAWGKVNYVKFKYKDAVVKKGDNARWHFGVVAQRVKAAFESEGIDPFAYGILCYDEWEEDEETQTPAGSMYGIRYEQALVLECAYLRSKIAL